jgi:hypothetical protein
MGEKQNQPFHLLFNASLKVDFQGSRVTSNGGLILVRELDERLGLEKLIARQLAGRFRRAKNEPSARRSLAGGCCGHKFLRLGTKES